MRRRTFIATAGTVALADCTASGDDGAPDPEDYSINGLEDSDVYHAAEIIGLSITDPENLFGDGGLQIGLEYDPDAEYDPARHEVYLMDGQRIVSEGEAMQGSISDSSPLIAFEVSEDDLGEKVTYRVVSKGVVDIADDFYLEVVRDD